MKKLQVAGLNENGHERAEVIEWFLMMVHYMGWQMVVHCMGVADGGTLYVGGRWLYIIWG